MARTRKPDNLEDSQIKEARAKLWQMGILEWKLMPTQKKMYDFIKENKQKLNVVCCSRRLGKSYYLTVIALEQCYKKPKSIVKFVQPEQKMIRLNIKPIFEDILKDCPKELKPTFNKQDNIYIFPNGSEIHLAGTDNGNHEKLRGSNADLCLVDEAGFCSDLTYVVNNILIPTTTLTKGKIILSSTVPPNSNHDFHRYIEQAEEKKSIIVKTIFDARDDDRNLATPRITDDIIQEIVDSIPGGMDSETFRVEYLCQRIEDSDDKVVPEFTGNIDNIVMEWPRPAFCDKYVSMDIGFKDLTVALFAFYDFENAVVVVEDEIIMNGRKMTTEALADSIKIKESDLWTDQMTGEQAKPYMRVSDNNLIVINDLFRLHGLVFVPTQKDDKHAQINNLRMMINTAEIKIHPRCQTLITHLKYATWDKNKKSFLRSADEGHYDAVDALVYLIRNIAKFRNPFPIHFKRQQIARGNELFINPNSKYDNLYSDFDKLFQPKKSNKFNK